MSTKVYDQNVDRPYMDKVHDCNTVDEVVAEYNRSANGYDEYFINNDFDGPRLVADAVLRLFPADGAIPRHEVKVMDIAAGTGLVGQRLYDAGLRQVDAVDGSSNMTQLSKARGVYRRVTNDVVGRNQLDIEDDTYDAVTISGAFIKDHLPLTALDEAIRICKPGGYVINSMRFEYLVTVEEFHRLEPHMDRLEQLGLWRRVDRYVTDRFFQTVKQGITYIYKKL